MKECLIKLTSFFHCVLTAEELLSVKTADKMKRFTDPSGFCRKTTQRQGGANQIKEPTASSIDNSSLFVSCLVVLIWYNMTGLDWSTTPPEYKASWWVCIRVVVSHQYYVLWTFMHVDAESFNHNHLIWVLNWFILLQHSQSAITLFLTLTNHSGSLQLYKVNLISFTSMNNYFYCLLLGWRLFNHSF